MTPYEEGRLWIALHFGDGSYYNPYLNKFNAIYLRLSHKDQENWIADPVLKELNANCYEYSRGLNDGRSELYWLTGRHG